MEICGPERDLILALRSAPTAWLERLATTIAAPEVETSGWGHQAWVALQQLHAGREHMQMHEVWRNERPARAAAMLAQLDLVTRPQRTSLLGVAPKALQQALIKYWEGSFCPS